METTGLEHVQERAAGPLLLEASGVAKRFNKVAALLDGRIALRPGSVNALCGGNGAGKSTFLGILMGLLRRDAGSVTIRGAEVDFSSPAEALDSGVAIITQELSPFLDMTVAENLYLGREQRRGRFFVDDRRMIADAEDILGRLKFDIPARARLRDLSVAQSQLVEITKAISRRSEILIMDEPTSAIGERETQMLFDAIRRLTADGVGIIYVSHRLTEIFEIADDYTVFRDGRFVGGGSIDEIDRKGLIRSIVGRDLLDHRREVKSFEAAKPLLEARGFSSAGKFSDINVTLHAGEIVGLYGLLGSGRSEFVNALYGTEPRDAGEIFIDGRPADLKTPAHSIRAGISLVTEDRKQTGLSLTASVAHNITVANLPHYARRGFMDGAQEAKSVREHMKRFSIKAASPDIPVQSLSGGNQQKVVLARCIDTNPRVLICDEPTRGVDEGAKREIYAFLENFVKAGNAVLMISSEIPEILGNADRIVVFQRGRVAGEVSGPDATQETLVHLAS
ncbi:MULTISPECIES: sugar ABC transporter ATP-binding protein [unclassified Agrobacterium]|uniref:sugar ABC transporter ATP-binding protein n=1 Tax=unclassified Agrobacterium TaxID=2632611 RepID=UPI00244D4BCF|nr:MULTISPECIES: sugar ABC transporter ATP-binding protein [unclassified Agrobacterium]MDH0613802.1 sugar ABC transporter ATP-binding protein [Agrobacterium sp. GD03872]MDH0696691.1 sugar ABC transporter ATP-binding protein [Agrobacterium sp. GD03871]MDH1060145.1 sugar ABC transporter ATP-binding protein [Agrobacterium sp. GD03992]MDH2210058.1 sugar ABC transporter ATP-binding protein [Agrobacterium sp. GD03643]MDH2219557.1 sugar ABC transporter ATP-binding protein [Agrobacterium sp. GD03638]